jgi:predicted nucleic acid-binding protein
MQLIADASVVASLFVPSERREVADRLLESNDLTAPDIVFAEVANALWLPQRLAGTSRGPAKEFLARIRRLVHVVGSDSLITEAFEIACDIDRPVYDALYLALARRIRSHVVTFDQKLLRKLAGTEYEPLARLLV